MPGLNQMTSTSSSAARSSLCNSISTRTSTSPSRRCRRPSTPRSTYLPTDLPNPPIYSKVNPADAPILTLALTSDTLPLTKVEDLADTTWRRKSRSCPASAWCRISGGQKPAVRIQANPTALASYGLSLEDLRTALTPANVEQAKGNFDGPRQSYTINANDQFFTARRLQAAHRRLSQRRAGAADRRRQRHRRRGKRPAGRLDEQRRRP